MPPADRKNPKRSTASESRYSLVEFMRDFPDDETCLRFLWNTRYNLGDTSAHCPRCEEIRPFRRYTAKQQRQDWTCTACGLHVHPTAGTIVHKSSTSLHLWFYAMYLMTSTRCGISAKQLERELGVTYKTAWRMFTLIRNELMAGDDGQQLSGNVEMDETYVGGKPRQSDKNAWRDLSQRERNKAAKDFSVQSRVPVFGMVERQGRVRAMVVPNSQADTLMPHVAKHVRPGSTVFTDDATFYRRVPRMGFEHHTVKHRAKVYVSGYIHTQTIEGFWSLVKRGITGTHHSVSRKWLQGYINEYAWRYNHRHDDKSLFALLVLRSAFPVVR